MTDEERAATSAHHGRLLDDHRRTALYGVLMLGALVFMVLGVGKHPTDLAPVTTLPAIGRLDANLYEAIVPTRDVVLADVFKLFDLTGKGIVTIPLRIALLAVLLLRRRFAAGIAFALTWASSEIAIAVMKGAFQRGRPPGPLVTTIGFSFPSGHATASAAIGVSIVLAFLRPGHRRRVWILVAVGIAFAMAFSRVYLGAHWLSDVVTGVLLGSVCAIGSFALVDEVRSWALRDRSPGASAPPPQGADVAPGEPSEVGG
jgi:membrane-associated phospholipid phosphatase